MSKGKCKNPSYVFEYFRDMVKKESAGKGLKPPRGLWIYLFAFLPHMLDFRVRLWDFWRNRSYGGRLEGILIKGHSPVAILLPIGLLYFIFFGPSGGHWNGAVLKLIFPIWLLIAFAVLGFHMAVNKIKSRKSDREMSRHMDTFDVFRVLIWSFVAAILIAGFSRGYLAHIGFLIFTVVLWAVFAFGSYADDKKRKIQADERCHIIRRLPWVSGLFLAAGLVLFYQYLLPMENEEGTSLFWLRLYVCIIAAIFLVYSFMYMRVNKGKQCYGSLSLWAQLGTLTAAGVLVWLTGGLKEIDNDIYRHVLIPLTAVILVVPLTIASLIARTIFRWRISLIGGRFRRLIELVEVFGSPKRPPLNPNKIFRSFLVTLRHVLMLLFPAALIILLMPYYLRDALKMIGGITLLITFIFIAFSKIHDRLGHLISLYRGMFFHGVQVIVSILVIILGITRLIDIGYVSYIVEASPLTLLTYILVTYLLLWLFEYWINRIFDEELLSLFDSNKRACGRVDFKYDNEDEYREGVRVSVRADNRRIQLHGNGRLVAVGDRQWFRYNPAINPYTDEFKNLQKLCSLGEEKEKELFNSIEKLYGVKDLKEKERIKREIQKKNYDDCKQRNGVRFQFYNRFDLLDCLVENAIQQDFNFEESSSKQGRETGNISISKGLSEIRNDLRWHVQDLRKQYVSYYAMLTMILVFGVLSQIFALSTIVDPAALVFSPPVEAGLVNTASEPGQIKNLFNLRDHLFIKSGNRPEGTYDDPEIRISAKSDPVILIAASGGGTRAALYATSLLQGLAELDLLDNVKLVSGVSGGGAALAYFYGHRNQLLKSSRGQPWADFYNAVSKDYIVRCLQGSGERRIAGGVRLGSILDEGFQDHFFNGKASAIGGNEIGILFNTTVAGEVHVPKSQSGDVALWAQNNPEQARSWAAGTRLIISNVLEAAELKNDINHVSRDGLRYTTIVRPDVSLATSAALNANFPPVFSNAAVDIGRSRYWVTDGGAMDNRGLITLLYVLREALNIDGKKQAGQMETLSGKGQAISDENRDEGNTNGDGHFNFPDIHIIVADASATTFDYSPKRGFGAISGSSTKLATGLIDELEKEVVSIYSKISSANRIYIHKLYMPLTMRARGGLGTHWMMPLMAQFKSCKKENKKEEDAVRLTRNQIIRAIAGLHQRDNEDNIGKLVMQDPWIVRMMGNDQNLEKLKEWYINDAAYLRGYSLQGERIDGKDNDEYVTDHDKAWEKFIDSIGKK